MIRKNNDDPDEKMREKDRRKMRVVEMVRLARAPVRVHGLKGGELRERKGEEREKRKKMNSEGREREI